MALAVPVVRELIDGECSLEGHSCRRGIDRSLAPSPFLRSRPLLLIMSGFPPFPEAIPGRRTWIGNLNKERCRSLIQDLVAQNPTSLFQAVLVRIIEKLEEEHNVLAFEDDATIPKLAWAARNICELRVISAYVCKSISNAERFQKDVLISGTSTQQALRRLTEGLARQVGAEGPTEDIYRLHAANQAIRESAGVGRDGPLMARTCAKAVGLEKDYLAFSSVTSPLVNPSAISVLKIIDLEPYRTLLVNHGLILATKLLEEARAHCDKHGFETAI